MVRDHRAATMGLQIDRRGSAPLFRQISAGVRERILGGGLAEGESLPPERLLARALGVNRSTVLAAYRELKDQGLISGHVGRGTIVLPRASGSGAGAALPWSQALRPAEGSATDPLIRDLLASDQTDVVSLALGLPAAEMLPLEDVRKILDRLVAEVGAEALLHSPTEGLPALREALCAHMAARGVRCSPSEVIVTSGSQQGFDLIARVFLAPGDAVIMEEPTYLGALQAFRRAGARVIGVPVDADGMRTDLLEPLLIRHRPRLIYTLPTFQNPSGSVMSLPRRRQILDVAHRHQVPLLEEDPYGDLRYEGRALPSLKAMDARGQVLHLNTFSKVLFPGLRVGWLVGPAAVVRQVAVSKQTADLHSGTLGQFVMARFLAAGCLERHLERVRPEYARRRDALLSALRAAARIGLVWSRPEGGFYVWCRLPEAIPAERLLAEAARERVSFLPGTVFSVEGGPATHIRLNFTASPPERIHEGVRRLARVLKTALAAPRPRPDRGEVLRPLV